MANRRGMVTGAKLERIGEAIREKTGSASQYTLDDMPDAIMSIDGGGGGESQFNGVIGNLSAAVFIKLDIQYGELSFS